jgi:hypothetical protein
MQPRPKIDEDAPARLIDRNRGRPPLISGGGLLLSPHPPCVRGDPLAIPFFERAAPAFHGSISPL